MTDESPAVVELQAFDALWDYGDPAGTETRLREQEPALRQPEDRDVRVQWLTQVARARGLQGALDDAHALLDEAESLLTPACVVGRVRCLLERGRAFNSAGGRRDEALAAFTQALEAATAAGAEFHAVDAAHMLGIVEEGEKALAWNHRAIALAEAARSEKARGWLGSLYNNTGWTHHDRGEHDQALAWFLKALAFRKERGQAKQVLIARWTVGRCLRSLGRYQEALALQRALLEEYEQAGHRDGFVYEEIGEILWAQGNKREARSWLRGAHELLSQVGWVARGEPKRLASLAERGQVQAPPPAPGAQEEEGR